MPSGEIRGGNSPAAGALSGLSAMRAVGRSADKKILTRNLQKKTTKTPTPMPVSPGVFVLSSLCVGVGAEDSRFFALLGSAPQELNTARPEAKLTCWKLHARNPNAIESVSCHSPDPKTKIGSEIPAGAIPNFHHGVPAEKRD